MKTRLSMNQKASKMNLTEVKNALSYALTSDQNPPLLVEVTAFQGCNKRCSYCFEKDVSPCAIDHTEQQRQIQLLLQLCESFDFAKYSRLKISFWGGEPMANYPFVLEVMQKTSKYWFVDWHIFTNGTLTSNFEDLILKHQDLLQIFKQGRLTIQVSFDGEPHHTHKRNYSPLEFYPTLKLLAGNGICFNFKGTIAADSIEMMPECWDSYQEMAERYPKQTAWAPTIDSTADLSTIDLNLWRSVLIQIAKKELTFIKQHHRPLLSWFTDSRHFCDVRLTTFMHSDGNFYLCHGAPYIQDDSQRAKFITGNTKSVTSIADVIDPQAIDVNSLDPRCSRCGATYCGACHINLVDPDNIRKDWCQCLSKDASRCQLMIEFGKIDRMLKLVLASRGILFG